MTTETYKEEKEHQAAEITEHWFKDHKSTLHEYGEITVLNWRKPETIIFSVRYVFDGANMYVSGDLGEAVFRFTEKAFPERIARYNLDYFCEKLRAFSGPKEDFSQEKAREGLKEYEDEDERVRKEREEKGILTSDQERYYASQKAAYEELRGIIEDCSSYDEYHVALASFDIYRMGGDAWEWIGSIGSATPMRLRAYLIGIQMAMVK